MHMNANLNCVKVDVARILINVHHLNIVMIAIGNQNVAIA